MDIEFLKSNVFPYVNLLIFLYLLVRFGKKPLQATLQGRREQFLKMRDEAAKLYNEAKAANDKIEARFAGLQNELAEIRKESIKAAEWEGQQTITRAKQLAQSIITDAQAQVDTMAKEAAASVREKLIRQVTEQATLTLKKQVSDNQVLSSKLIESNIKQAAQRGGELTR